MKVCWSSIVDSLLVTNGLFSMHADSGVVLRDSQRFKFQESFTG